MPKDWRVSAIPDARQTLLVVAPELPEPFDRIEFRAVGRQGDEGDVGRHDEIVADMPSGAIDQHRGMGVRRDGETGLRQHQVHRLGVDPRHDDGGAGVAPGTNGAEQIGRLEAMIADCRERRTARVGSLTVTRSCE